LTKDNTSIVQIPVDPARRECVVPSTGAGLSSHTATTIQRSLKDVGSDLVANLGVVTDLSVHISHLAGWCGAIKADLVAGGLSSTLTQATDGTDSFTHLQSIRTRWAAIKKSTREYHKIVRTATFLEGNVPNDQTIGQGIANPLSRLSAGVHHTLDAGQ
jgi:hypothetical protein